MLTICNEPLPETDITYIAFRLACCDTLERLVLAEQIGETVDPAFGFLTEVPFLKHVPPRVQLDVLAETWRRHRHSERLAATLLDEGVIYAACETAGQLVASDPATAARFLADGPRVLESAPAPLQREIEAVHLDLANEGNFLLISQFQDIPPDEARALKRKFGIAELDCEPMFEVLGRWHVSPDFAGNAAGLLTEAELSRAVQLLGLQRSSRIAP